MSVDYSKIHTHNTAAWRLWFLRYDVFIPELATASAGYIKQVGANRSGDRIVDRHRVNPMERTWMTAAGLAMIYADGNAFAFAKPSDSIQMYVDIQKHLQDWHEMTYTATPAAAFPPIDDLRTFEALAMEVHNTVMTIMPRADDRSALMDRLLAFGHRRNRLVTQQWETNRSKGHNGEIRPYHSKVDRIEEFIYSER